MHRALRAALIVCWAAVVLTGMAPARAHDSTTFFPQKWSGWDRKAITIYHEPSLGGAELSRVLDGAKAWDNLKQSSDFVWKGKASLTHDPCAQNAWNKNIAYKAKLDGARGQLGSTIVCRSSTRVLRFVMIFDSSENWYSGPSGVMGPTQPDLYSVSAHEFGHALGWRNHFDDATKQSFCANIPSQETMCSTHIAGTARQRSLGTHDIHSFNAAY